MKKRILWVVVSLILVAVASSGWVFNTIQTRNNVREKELETLMSAFNLQYGTDGITIKQLVSPKNVYVAAWTSKDGIAHVSWNIGGIWVTVYSAPINSTTEDDE
jgi:hypothetical protein